MKYIYIVTYVIAYSYITTVCPNDNNGGLNLGYYNGSNKCTVKHEHKVERFKDTSIAFKSLEKALDFMNSANKNFTSIDSVVIK